jgi:hypothetical protein
MWADTHYVSQISVSRLNGDVWFRTRKKGRFSQLTGGTNKPYKKAQ